MKDLTSLQNRVVKYKEMRSHTEDYRKAWEDGFRDNLIDTLKQMCQEVDLEVYIEHRDQYKNLEAILVSLGKVHSGIYEELEVGEKRQFVRSNGMLVYQQLFNGKIVVMIIPPMIEGIGEPQPSKMVAIYRPEELSRPFMIRHLEELLRTITEWEDYDDDDQAPKKIGFNVDYHLDDLGEQSSS